MNKTAAGVTNVVDEVQVGFRASPQMPAKS